MYIAQQWKFKEQTQIMPDVLTSVFNIINLNLKRLLGKMILWNGTQIYYWILKIYPGSQRG